MPEIPTDSFVRPRLEVICNDRESRTLLEQLKFYCHNGWFFETFRIESDGFMAYKFFLLDLSKQESINDEQYVRYFGWVEAIETEDSVIVKASGELEKFVAPELRQLLIQRFHDDMLEPVGRRERMRVMLTR